MEMLLKKVEDMSIEELQAEVKELRTKHVYFFQTEDFASVLNDEDVEFVKVFTEEEMNNDELQEAAFHALRGENFSIHEWAEQISEALEYFDKNTIRLLATIKHRYFTND